jgi:hypothetical protein
MYRFGQQNSIDPSAQTEDLGDDAIKASDYGIKNLKRIVPNLIKWTSKDGETYDDLEEMYGHVVSQFNRYMGHVTTNIGGIYKYSKTTDQDGVVFSNVDKDYQKNSLAFLNEQLFETPEWLIDKDIIARTEFNGVTERIRGIQVRTLNNVLDLTRMMRMIDNETLNGSDAYSVISMMTDLRDGIWSELNRGRSIDAYRRNLQRAHVERLATLMESKDVRGRRGTVTIKESDILPIVRGELNRIKRLAQNAIGSAPNTISRYHLHDIVERINAILDPK